MGVNFALVLAVERFVTDGFRLVGLCDEPISGDKGENDDVSGLMGGWWVWGREKVGDLRCIYGFRAGNFDGRSGG